MIGLKLFNTINRTEDIRRHLWKPHKRTIQQGDDTHLIWRDIQPLIGLIEDTSVNLSDAELNLLVRTNQNQFMMDLTLVISRYQSINRSMREYQLRYDTIMALMPPIDEMTEGISVHLLNRRDYMKIKPYSNALEGLIQSLREMSSENVAKAKDIAPLYKPMMKAYFKTGKFLDFGLLPIPPITVAT